MIAGGQRKHIDAILVEKLLDGYVGFYELIEIGQVFEPHKFAGNDGRPEGILIDNKIWIIQVCFHDIRTSLLNETCPSFNWGTFLYSAWQRKR